MSRTGGSLLVPLVLLVVITVLLYFHWGLRRQVSSFHEERDDLREKLTAIQQERDGMAAEVHRFTEQLNLASQEKRGHENQKKALNAKLDEAQVNLKSINVRLLSAQEAQRTAEEKLTGKDDELDRATSELEDHKQRYQQCKATLSEKESQVATLTDNHQDQLSSFQRQLAGLQQDKAALVSQLSEQGDKLQAVEGELHKCQQAQAMAGRGNHWEGNVQEGHRFSMRRGGQSDIQRLKQQRMPQRKFTSPGDHLHQQAQSIRRFTQPPPSRYQRELGQWKTWPNPRQERHVDQFGDPAAQDNLAGQHGKAPDEQSHTEDHPARIHQEQHPGADTHAEEKDQHAGPAQYDELEHGGDLADNGHLNNPADPHYRSDEMGAHQRQQEQQHKVPGEPDGEDLVGDGGLQQQGQDEDRDNEDEEDKQHKAKEEVALHAPKVVEQKDMEHKRNDAL